MKPEIKERILERLEIMKAHTDWKARWYIADIEELLRADEKPPKDGFYDYDTP